MANAHVIELNGNKYDALTGKVIAAPSAQAVTKPAVDGFIAPKKRAATLAKSTQAPKTGHRPESSHTLMRASVKKPIAHAIHSVTTHPHQKVQAAKVQPKHTAGPTAALINPMRVARSNHIPKSMLVSKFGKKASSATIADVPLKAAPAQPPSLRTAPAKANQEPEQTHNPFETALQNATSHERPKLRKLRVYQRLARTLHMSPRALLISVGGLSVLVIGGFVAYTRMPNVAMRVAATRAGIHATLPSYQPAGFSLKGPIATMPGQISVNYKSNSDDRDFKVTQRGSSWNSEALLDNFVATTKKSYQTFQSAGRTIYIYDGSNATWVDGGIWYQIEGRSSLNSDQLLRIANSL